jgi:shikimate kinase
MMKDNPRNLVLTGFMGTGKTTVGKRIASVLDLRFIDSDEEIVRRAKMTIPQIFEQFGETGFRHLESVICRWLSSCSDVVISTGGGMLVNVQNLGVMSKTGLVVCLNASPEVIRERLQVSNNRPLKANWEVLYEQRRSAYAAIPYQIETTGKTPDEVSGEVIALWQSSR